MEYCQFCGGKVAHKVSVEYVCEACGKSSFANPKAAVGIVLYKDANTILLSRRALDPYKGAYDFFGGFLDAGETLEAGLERELQEEVGLEPGDVTDVTYLTSVYDDYPFQGHPSPVTAACFAGRLRDGAVLNPQDDVAAIEELDINQLEEHDFADNSVVYDVVLRVRDHLSQGVGGSL